METNPRVTELLLQHGYQSHKMIGVGGFGSVFLVKSMKYNELFVAKTIYSNNIERKGVNKKDEINFGSELNDVNYDEHSLTNILMPDEVNTLRNLSHPNVINMYETFFGKDNDNLILFIIFEYCPCGTLKDMINTLEVERDNNHQNHKQLVDDVELINYSKQIALAVQHCHSRSVVHRDIKPANLLFDKYGRLKLADFGLATFVTSLATKTVNDKDKNNSRESKQTNINFSLANNNNNNNNNNNYSNKNDSNDNNNNNNMPNYQKDKINSHSRLKGLDHDHNHDLNQKKEHKKSSETNQKKYDNSSNNVNNENCVIRVGTPAYMPPEILSGEKISNIDFKKADIWSLGISIYELALGYLPFTGCTYFDLLAQAKAGINKPKELTDLRLFKLLRGMLNPSMEERFSIEQVLNSDYFKDNENRISLNSNGVTGSTNALINGPNLNCPPMPLNRAAGGSNCNLLPMQKRFSDIPNILTNNHNVHTRKSLIVDIKEEEEVKIESLVKNSPKPNAFKLSNPVFQGKGRRGSHQMSRLTFVDV